MVSAWQGDRSPSDEFIAKHRGVNAFSVLYLIADSILAVGFDLSFPFACLDRQASSGVVAPGVYSMA